MMDRAREYIFLTPSGRGLSAKPTGGEKMCIMSLPPSTLRVATSLAEGGRTGETYDVTNHNRGGGSMSVSKY